MIIIKTPEQIEKIRASCKVAAATLEHVGKLITPGVTTDALNKAAADFMAERGAISATLNYKGPHQYPFPKETCVSVNEVVCHGISSDRILKEGDIVKVDVTTILDGYFGDTCKTFPVGHVTKKTRDLMNCGEDCLRIGINQIKPGKPFENIGIAIDQVATNYKYSIVRSFCGHGVGVEFHEDPQVLHFNAKIYTPTMKPGYIFTVEPMICQGQYLVTIDESDHWTVKTLDGKLSVQNEHTVLVTPTGVEILTLP